jgi:S1-C subfamily serine protease
MRKPIKLVFLVFFLTFLPSTAQTIPQESQKETKSVLVGGKIDLHEHALGNWKFVKYDNVSKNIVQIHSQQLDKRTGRVGSAAGTGVIVKCQRDEIHPENPNFYRGYILTCDHVVPKSGMIDGTLEIRFQNGVRISEEAVVVMNHEGHDVALVRCWIPFEYEGLVLSKSPLGFGDKVRMIGYGGVPDVTKPRYFEAQIYRWSPNLITVLEDAARGDSGGAIVNEKGQLVGLISRGASSFQKKDGLTITSPLHGPAANGLIMIINGYLQTQSMKKHYNVPSILNK